MSSAGSTRAARSRKWNRGFDASPYFELVGAEQHPTVLGSGKLPSGRFISFSPGKPGKVTVILSQYEGSGLQMRTFGAGQEAAIAAWVAGGGVLESEERRKAITAAAPKLLEALRDHLRWYDGGSPGLAIDEGELIARTRALVDSLPLPEGDS